MKPSDTALTPPKILFRPDAPRFLDENRLWQGIPSVEITEGGTLYAIFYSGGKTEQRGNFAVLIKSADGGRTWNGPELAVEHLNPEMRVFDPNIWCDPLGRLWLFWAQSLGFYDGRAGVWASVCSNPDADTPVWGAPSRIGDGVMMNKPTVTKCGDWVFPCAGWAAVVTQGPRPELEAGLLSNVYVSSDGGKTFAFCGGADIPGRSFDEHMITELSDSRLWMLVRTEYGIGQSFSPDGGKTWSAGEDSGLGGPCSRFFIRRLSSGRLLLVNHINFDGRNNITAVLSEDDGKSWLGGLLLDPRKNVSYPDGTQGADGRLYVVYDRERYKDKEILLAVFTEEDILAEQLLTKDSQLSAVINRAGGNI